jgi:Transposase DDE domain
VRVPDSSVNRTHFGGHPGGGKRGDSGYPLARLVALMTLRSHLIQAVRFGPFSTDERRYAEDLFAALPEQSLLIVDRNFFAAARLLALQGAGGQRHWLIRLRSRARYRVLEQFGPTDALVEVRVSHKARQQDPSLPRRFHARLVGYQRPGHAAQLLLTSLLDPEAYPAEEIAALYHERWEIELGYDELKTELLESEETLRSQSPAAVAQEIWGLLLAYNLVRLEMERVAEEAHVDPVRISFVAALRLIRDEWLWCAVASPGAIPRHLKRLRQDLKLFILPERRPERSYPRAVKRKMSHYARKRPAQPPPQA